MRVAPRGLAMFLFPLALASAVAHGADPLTPGAIADTLKKPAELQPPPPVAAPSAPARPEAPAGAAGTQVTVQRFDFNGNTLFDAETLRGLIAGYTGKPISLVELYEAADRITDHYVSAGYTLASALIPAQKISEGTVLLEIIEGRVDKVRYEGLKRYRPADLDVYVGSAAGRIYRGAEFEDGLRSIDALPGASAKAVLRPAETYGSTDVVVQLQEDPFEGMLFGDNGGRDTAGEYRVGTQLIFNSPLRVGDQLTLLGMRSTDNLLKYLSASYSLPTGWRGSRVNLSYGYAGFKLDGDFQGVRGSNRNGKVELELPMLRGGPETLTLTGGVSATRADTDFSGIPLRGTELALLELGASYSRAYASGGVSQLLAEVASNFQESDGSDPNAQLFRLELDAQYIHPLPMSLQLAGRGLYVYTPDPLPDTQQFSLGGPGTVRGYAPSEIRGDWGYFGSLTLRRNFPLGPAVLTPRLFVDAGSVRSRAPSGTVPELSLSSVGIGADASLRSLSFKLDYAIPTDALPVSDGKDSGRVYGTFAVQF